MNSAERIYSLFKKSRKVCTDTRSIAPGSIFFALQGERFNGNEFAEKALNLGCVAAIIDDEKFRNDERYILVDDVLKSLQHLAFQYRQEFSFPVIGITGSNGKTTTKELIARVLSRKYKTHFTLGNLNNHIGVPLTILQTQPDTEMLVVEMGANHQGEIALLSSIACPDYGIITNVGKAHLEGFGGFEGVKKGKGELYAYLAANNRTAFINGDNDWLIEMASSRKLVNTINYGRSEKYYCSGVLSAATPYLNIEWRCGYSHGKIRSRITGDYNFENILSAVCIGNYFKVDPGEISKAVEEYIPDNSRSQVIQSGTNTIVLDAYNANPTSMKASLDNFASMQGDNKIVLLGQMAELGESSEEEHRSILLLLNELKLKNRVLVGSSFVKLKEGEVGNFFNSVPEAADWLKTQSISHHLILVKGSRSMKMEELLSSLNQD